MKTPRILVAGVGNVLFGDDGFGPAVAVRLARAALPDGVRVMDAGIRGYDLAMALDGDYDAAILVDAARRGHPPGTLSVLDPQVEARGGGSDAFDGHDLGPDRVLALLGSAGRSLRALRVVACEPATFGDEYEPTMELSPAVAAAVEPAVELVRELLGELAEVLAPAPEAAHA